MNRRAVITIVLAIVLMAAVLLVAWALSLSESGRVKYASPEVWAQPAASEVQSMKIIDLTGDKQNDLFVQTTDTVSVLDASGRPLFTKTLPTPLATTMGDVDGDGVEDIVIFSPRTDEGGTSVLALRGNGEPIWAKNVENTAAPSRVALVRFASGSQIILGDLDGQLVALNTAGDEMWRSQLSQGDYIRTLDNTVVDGQPQLAAANHDGTVAVYTDQGTPLWTQPFENGLRRLRAYDLDGDGNGELLIGGDGSTLHIVAAADGQDRFSNALGQTITEIREAELDGKPAAREFVVGGKDGGVWAFRADGAELWADSLSDRVTAIASLDVDDDGRDDVIVGDEGGKLNLFGGADGSRFSLASSATAITRLDGGRLTDSDQVAVADGGAVRVLALEKETAPGWYNPLWAGLIAALVIAVAAWFVATMPSRATMRAAAEDQSAAGLLARRRMLHESIADVERLKRAGEMPSDAYLARIKELRGDLADTEAALIKANVKIEVETFKCPNCGGTLPLGVDRCDYCGQVVIA